MKQIHASIALLLMFMLSAFAQKEKKVYTTTPTYEETIKYVEFLGRNPNAKVLTYGTSDVGKPLHLLVLSKSRIFDPKKIDSAGLAVLFILNGIHPGEPDGVDASLELARSLLSQPSLLPENTVICIVPYFNIDGALNRGKNSRANQNGPEEYGFRGNARNLDLNRDFIKCDSKNTQTLIHMLRLWDPDIFVDNHVSNGADYQYVITLINTQKDKLNPVLSEYMQKQLNPFLYSEMKNKGYEMAPYVEPIKEVPDDGIAAFLETPRFSTGYTTQFNTIGYVVETHMWKSYNDRVWATYNLLMTFVEKTGKDASQLIKKRKEAFQFNFKQDAFCLNWKHDTTNFRTINFKGFEAFYKTSELSGKQRLWYDRSKPYSKKIKFYDTYSGVDTVYKQAYYIIPQAWHEVIEKLKLNGIAMKQFTKDTLVSCQAKYITEYKTYTKPYEGHYPHYAIQTKTKSEKINFYKGDYCISSNQEGVRFLIETLEPKCEDSFFAWGFFDAILQQKEWFSDYIFEEKAIELLKTDVELKKMFEEKKQNDSKFANDHWSQLNFIYQNSYYKEPTHNRYPVYFVSELISLPLSDIVK